MPRALTAIRAVGILGATWLIFALVSAHFQIHEQTKDFLPSSVAGGSFASQFFWRVSLPCGLLAVFLMVPYSKINRLLRIGGSLLIVLFAAYLLAISYGRFFLSDRFVPDVIPAATWAGLLFWVGFFPSQVLAIMLLPGGLEARKECLESPQIP